MDGFKVIFNWDYLDVLADKILTKSINIHIPQPPKVNNIKMPFVLSPIINL